MGTESFDARERRLRDEYDAALFALQHASNVLLRRAFLHGCPGLTHWASQCSPSTAWNRALLIALAHDLREHPRVAAEFDWLLPRLEHVIEATREGRSPRATDVELSEFTARFNKARALVAEGLPGKPRSPEGLAILLATRQVPSLHITSQVAARVVCERALKTKDVIRLLSPCVELPAGTQIEVYHVGTRKTTEWHVEKDPPVP